MLRRIISTVATFAGLLIAGVAAAAERSSINMPVGVTPVSEKVHDLHMLIFSVCVAIAVVVFGAMIYCIMTYRKSKGAVPSGPSHSTKVEIVWTVIPTLILIAMAVPSARTLVEIEDTRGTEMTIKITGYQWKWHYEYLGEGVGFFSSLDPNSNAARRVGSGIDPATVDHYLLNVDQPLVVPVGVKIRYLITANDVLHAWWVPDFAIKKDAIPGFINEGWFQVQEPGTYRGQCAELCGKDHGFMPVVVEALPREEFDAWLADQKAVAAIQREPSAQVASR